jgi:hypothetical protein
MRRCVRGQGVRAVMILAIALAARNAQAQVTAGTRSWAEMTTGSELEQYLRVLQLTGAAPLAQLSLRGWSAFERDSLLPRGESHPWGSAMIAPAKRPAFSFEPIRPQLQLIGNSGWPYGSNDGAIWAGRGLTTAVSGGFELRGGPLTVVIDPVFFRAENQAFAMQPVPLSVRGAPYNDPVTPGNIDLPQRFGSAAYQRFDPGQSTIRLDLFGLTIGASTANEIWGPAITSPIILGNNAAGIPRIFLGTSEPLNIGIGRIHGRMFLGQTGQSDWSPIDTTGGKRLAAGLVGVFEPRGTHGVEIGFGRFFHRFWPSNGLSLSDLSIPLGNFLNHGVDPAASATGTADNQLFSVFARVVLPHSGLELYGEYGREDHSYDFRDLAGEPDHISAYTFGLMHTWRSEASVTVTALRAEVTNSRVTDIAGGRGEGLFYEHSPIAQGHTQFGQLLGSAAVRGGGGATVALDRYSPDGRVTFSFTRTDEAGEVEGGLGTGATSALTMDVLRFHRGFDLSGQLGVVFDTGVQSSTDRLQLHASIGARFPVGF